MATRTRSTKSRSRQSQATAETPPEENGAVQAPEEENADPNRRVVIDTLAPKRPYAVIDDERHDYRMLHEFGSRDRHELARLVEEYEKLNGSQQKLSNEKGKRLDWLIDWLFDHLLLKPDKLREQLAGVNPETGLPRLTGVVKQQVVDAFFNSPEAQMMQQILSALAQRNEAQNGSTSTS